MHRYLKSNLFNGLLSLESTGISNSFSHCYAWTPEPMDTRASLKGLDLPEAQMDLDLLVVSICPLIYKIEINIILHGANLTGLPHHPVTFKCQPEQDESSHILMS